MSLQTNHFPKITWIEWAFLWLRLSLGIPMREINGCSRLPPICSIFLEFPCNMALDFLAPDAGLASGDVSPDVVNICGAQNQLETVSSRCRIPASGAAAIVNP